MPFNKVFLLAALLLLAFGLTDGASIGLSNQQEIDLEKGLVAYWPFDEGEGDIAFDESVNHNDAGLVCVGEGCSPPTWAEGRIGLAVSFDGTDDYVTFVEEGPFDEFTYAAWIYPKDCKGTKTIFGGPGGNNWPVFQVQESILKMRLYDSQNRRHGVFIGNEVKCGSWVHVAVTFKEGYVIFYTNGESSATQAIPNFSPAVKGVSFLGGRPAHAGERMLDGLIDEARIYNRKLSGAEVERLYQMGAK